MQFTYTLQEDDYLQFQLFTASQSPRLKRRKKTGWLILTTLALMGSLYFIKEDNRPMAIYLGVVTAVVAIFYPLYFRWKYKKHYTKFIRQNYSNRVGTEESIEFKSNHLFLKDVSGEGKVNNKEIDNITEISNHYFMKISNGNSIIIPKSLSNHDQLLKQFKKLKVTINTFTEWKWQ